jgi:3-oxoacyl-[acyl-carrier-protein] synthase II
MPTSAPAASCVITGVGAISSAGMTADALWGACRDGRSGVRRTAAFDAAPFPCRIAAEAWGFDPLDFMTAKEASRSARFVQFAVASAQQAVDQACLNAIDADRLAVVWGTGSGGTPYVNSILPPGLEANWRSAEPLALLKVIPDSAATALAMRYGARGPVSTVVAACVSSTLAIVHAVRLIREGLADAAIAGGSEAWITLMGIASFSLLHALSTGFNDEPEAASRPFDARRDGFVPAEGAGALVIESAEHAAKRGASPIAVISGAGVTNDAHHASAQLASGAQAARAIQLALDDAGVRPESIGYVNAHGTSTRLNDVAETAALKLALGEHAYRVPVNATKSITGHGLGASGAWETIVTALSLRDQVVHPTINLEAAGSACDLDYVPRSARSVSMQHALKVSFGFGGQNVALVLSRA